MKRWIAAVLAGILIASITTLLVFFPDPRPGSLELEVAKSLLQLGVVAVIGTAVSVLVFEYQRERQTLDRKADLDRQAHEKHRDLERKSLEYREALLLSILSRAMDAYGEVKKSRRLLRARAISSHSQVVVVLAAPYDNCFDMLNDAQLALENLARDVETSAKAFSDTGALVSHLRLMDSYLGELITEFEDSRRRFAGDEASLPLNQLPFLEDFIKPTKESKFMPSMVVPYHEVQRRIRGALLHPHLIEAGQTPNNALQLTVTSGASLAASGS